MRLSRRSVLSTPALAAAAQHAVRAGAASKLAMPGPYPGRVAAIEHAGSIDRGAFQPEAVRQMMARGMMELTGAPGAPDAWRVFFEKGDVVGLKLNAVGRPHVISDPSVVREIIRSLNEIGIPVRDILVYDRPLSGFQQAGFAAWLPDGVRWTTASQGAHPFQLDMEGYDADQYLEMALTQPDAPPGDPHYRRSYVAKFLTKQVNKMINLCLLKHHQSAGITIALKNMSHGLVNNVRRSHFTPTLNACGSFIPAVVDLPVIRQKCVLHIADGIKAAYHGGPGSKVGPYVWEHKTMYFASDPVALDRIGWSVIDAKRVAMGMRPVGEAKPDADSNFYRMQPEHVEIAGALGLGEYDEEKIQVRRVKLA